MKKALLACLAATLLLQCNPANQDSNTSQEMTTDSLRTDSLRNFAPPSYAASATIYEANIRQYSEAGTLDAFTADLERIKGLGIKIIWLMPIHPIGEVNRKGEMGSYYSVKDYLAVNPEFGTIQDLKELVARAHELDMKVILDWVANHSAFDNVWTENHKDWYRLDSLGVQQPPEGTDWYDVADLNYENEQMRQAMIDAMVYWVKEADIDGYRCDVADLVPLDFWVSCRAALEEVKPEIFMLAEGDNPELHRAFDMTYAFEFLHIMEQIAANEANLADIDEYLLARQKKYQPQDIKMYFTTSHDENSWNGTVFERVGDQAHLTFATLAYTIDGMPMLYSGQEAGLDHALKFFDKDLIEWGDSTYSGFYSKLLHLHRTNPALFCGAEGGSFRRINSSDDNLVYAFERYKGEHSVVTICYFGKVPARITFTDLPKEGYTSLFGQEDLSRVASEGIELSPYAYHVFYK